MKLNWAERLVVNNPLRALEQGLEIRWMKRAMPLREGAAILEVGCGRGAGASRILKEFKPAVLHAMDLDPRMIRQARKFLSPAEREKVTVYVGDVLNLPYRNASLDAVFCFGVLHHVPQWRKGLAELARILKPGGYLFIEELYPSVYQNVITKHILLHPTEDRFMGDDFRRAVDAEDLVIHDALEIRLAGILAVLNKRK